MTTNDLAVRNGTVAHQSGALAIQDGQAQWTPMQAAALAQLGVKDAPDGDKQVFLHVSQRTGLDPFARQIYMIPRNEKKSEKRGDRWVDVFTVKWTIQTGIEGWRVIRDRAERRYGVRGIKSRFTYYAPDGSGHPVWVRREPPVACEMTYTVVEETGREVPYTSILRFDEYAQYNKDGDKLIAQWGVKPTHMLEKCTEADAYRCAFPQDYSGVVLDDAMPPAEDVPQVPQKVSAEEIRSRPRRPQQVKAEVVPPEDAPWPGDAPADASWAAKAADGSRRMAEHAAEGQLLDQAKAADPRDDVRAWFERAGITSHETQMNYAGALLEAAPPASLDSLARVQAVKLAARLSQCPDKDALDVLLATGEVPGAE